MFQDTQLPLIAFNMFHRVILFIYYPLHTRSVVKQWRSRQLERYRVTSANRRVVRRENRGKIEGKSEQCSQTLRTTVSTIAPRVSMRVRAYNYCWGEEMEIKYKY